MINPLFDNSPMTNVNTRKLRWAFSAFALSLLLNACDGVQIEEAPVENVDGALAQDSGNQMTDDRRYIIVLNDWTSAQVPDRLTFDRERNQLRQKTISDYTGEFEIKVQYEYSNVFNGFAASLSEQAYAALLTDSRVNYIEADENLQEKTYVESVNQPTIDIDVNSDDLSSTEDRSSVTIYLLGRGAKPSRSILQSRIVSGVNLTEQGGLDNWQNCKEENKTAVRLAQESTKNKHQINLYPIKVSNCIGQTSWSEIVAGLDWVMSRPIEKEGVIDVPVSSDGWSGKQSVIQAIDSLTSLGFAIVDRSGSARRYHAEGVTAEPVSKAISDSLKMLKKKKNRALERRQKPSNQNSLGSLSPRNRDSAKANQLLIDPNFNPPLADILAFTPMILECVPQVNTSAAIFHGCVDWHSSVHGNWALLWASRVSGDPSLRDGIFNRFTEGNVSTELNRVLPFELTYGFAWFLDLAHEAELLGNTALRPLADYFYSQLLATLDINALPVVGVGGNPISTASLGSYDNDAWAVFQAYQWAEYINDTAAQNMLIERVTIHYQNVDWSRAYTDFFDAKFLAAMMMVKMNITGPSWDNLMAAIAQDSLAVPRLGGGSHSEGVVSARAWGLWALYVRTGSATYLNAYNAHVASNLSRASYWSQSYTNSHWLGQFAIFTLQLPEILPASGDPINFAPTVNAGPDQATTLPNVATLSASVTDDGLPNSPSTVTTQWSAVSGPGSVTFGNTNAVSTTASFSVAGNYVLRLSANDGELVTNDELQVSVSTAGSTFNAISSLTGGSTNRGNWVLGYRFTVNTPITVSELGIAEMSGNNVLDNNQAASIAIWTNLGVPVSQTSIPASTPLSDDGYYVAISPIDLTPGEYVIAATFTSSGEPYRRRASVITAPQISFGQALWSSGSTLRFPTSSNGTVWDDGFFGPSFNFSETTTSNRAPTVFAGADQDIDLANTASLSASISDDGLPNPPSTVTTQWSVVSGPGSVTFGDATTASTTASFSVAGNYVLRLSANDGELVTNDELQVSVSTTTAQNQAPTVFAGADQDIDLANTASLSASISDDGLPNPPSTVTTQWSVVSGPGSVTFDDTNAVSTTASFSVAGNYVLRLSANDGELVTSDELQVSVSTTTAQNQAPAVFAGADQDIDLANTASLSASISDDGLPNPPSTVTTQWSVVSGPGSVTFGDATTASTTASFSVAGNYVLRLSANDGELVTNDELQVSVSTTTAQNQAPTVFAGADQDIDLANTASLSASISDDGLPNPPSTVTTQWSVVSGPGSVTFDDTNAVSTTASFTVAGNYVLRLSADDGELVTNDELQVSVSTAGSTFNAISSLTGGSTNRGNWVLGYRFTVNTPITVSELGIAEMSGNNVLDNNQAASIAIWTNLGVPVSQTSIPASTPLSDDGYYVAISPIDLTPGEYVIAATFTSSGEPYRRRASVITAPQISFGQALWSSGSTLRFPTSSNGTVWDDGFFGPSFNFSETTTSNRAPTVFAGADQDIDLANTASLSASISDDGLPNPPSTVTTQWSVVSGPGSVTFGDATTASTTASFSVAGNYVLRLSANDGELVTNDELQVSVSTAGTTFNAISSVTGGSTNRGNWVLGYRFTVNTPITVSELGIAEVSGNNALDNSQAASIAIWTNSGVPVSQTSIPASTPLSDDGYYVAISPVDLTPGQYVIAATFTSSGEPYRRQASVTTAPQISFGQALWSSGSTLRFPTSSNGTVWDDGFFGPSFNFSETTVSNRPPTVFAGADQDIDLANTARLLQVLASTVVAPDLESALDSDGDGVPDTLDAFPNYTAEQFDRDGDGTGDNADAFPNDSTETADSDGDGAGDNVDVYPNDPTRIDDDPVEVDGLSIILNTSRWSLISIPADPSDNGTLERLFGDDLPAEQYGPGGQWVVYSYDSGMSQYRALELSETLQANTAYWIFQQLGEPVEIDLPANQPTLPGSAVSGCIADRQCVTVQLSSNGSSATWNLVGYSSSSQVRFGDTRFITSSGVCANGCTPAEARAANVASDVLFRLNSAGDDYELVTEDTPLLPWDSYWLMTMAAVDQPQWVMPVDSE